MSEELFGRFLVDAHNRNDEIRLSTCDDLKFYLDRLSRELSSDTFIRALADLNRTLFSLISSQDPTDKLSAITLLPALLTSRYEENETKNIRFANYLRMVFQSTGLGDIEQRLLREASSCLGVLVRTGGASVNDIVEFEVKRSLEWMEGTQRDEQRRYCALLVLSQLATHSPTLFNLHINSFLDHIWITLRDSKPIIREVSVEALRAVLLLVAHRNSKHRYSRYLGLWSEVLVSVRTQTSEWIHGALLCIGDLLKYTGDFMTSRYREAADIVMRLRDHKDKYVRETVITLMPLLAAYNSEIFLRHYYRDSISHILGTLKAGHSRPLCFLSIASLASALHSNISPDVDSIVALVKEGLTARTKKAFCSEALTCIAKVAAAVGPIPKLTTQMRELIELMFSAGLSSTLVSALTTIAAVVPDYLSAIQDQLLTAVTVILTSSTSSKEKRTFFSSFLSSTHTSDSTDLLYLALDTLGTFDFSSHNLLPFCVEVVCPYLEHGERRVRRVAAITLIRVVIKNVSREEHTVVKSNTLVSNLLSPTSLHRISSQPVLSRSMTSQPQSYVFPTSPRSPNTATLLPSYIHSHINTLLDRLLTVALSDSDIVIRTTVLDSLSSPLDPYLTSSESISYLFTLLTDESLSIRLSAGRVLGRLSLVDPSAVLPHMRETVIQLLSELQYGDWRVKEESSGVMSVLVSSSGPVLRPYVPSILHVLLVQLSDIDRERHDGSTNTIVTSLLTLLTALAPIGGVAFIPHLHTLLPLLTSLLTKTNAAITLRTLVAVVSHTGHVVDIYASYPSLLPTLLRMCKDEVWDVRQEVIRLIGVCGAYDPYRYKQLYVEEKKEEIIVTSLSHSHEDYYPTVTITALLRILRDTTLTIYHIKVIQLIMYILKQMTVSKMTLFLSSILPPFISVCKESTDEALKETLVTQIGVIVTLVKSNIKPYIQELIDLLLYYWNLGVTHESLFVLVERLSLALKEEFRLSLPLLLPSLLSLLSNDKSSSRSVTYRVLHSIETIIPYIEDYLHLIVPPILRLIEIDNNNNVRVACLHTISTMCKFIYMHRYITRIIHPLARLLLSTNTNAVPMTPRGIPLPSTTTLRDELLLTLCTLLLQLQSDFLIYIPLFTHVMVTAGIHYAPYETLVTQLVGGMKLDTTILGKLRYSPNDEKDALYMDDDDTINTTNGINSNADINTSGSIRDINKNKNSVNQVSLKKAWEVSQRSTAEDWIEWCRTFSLELLKESPSPSLRALSTLATKHVVLGRELFPSSFLSCWLELSDEYRDDCVKCVEWALLSHNIPPDLIQLLLNLLEFMEREGERLPIDATKLGVLAENVHAYAKALHYKESDFSITPYTSIESLISIHNHLQQPDSAVGILTYARTRLGVEIETSWYEKLQRWEDALDAYTVQQCEDMGNTDVMIGRMRCLRQLGEWERLDHLASSLYGESEEMTKREIAPLAATAAWNLRKWKDLPAYINFMDDTRIEGEMLRAILAIHHNDYSTAHSHINHTRELLDSELTALVSESYHRAYRVIIQIQQCTELEEIIEYKVNPTKERKQIIQSMWTKRLYACQENVDIWQSILSIRSLVMSPDEDVNVWLKFAALCRKSGRLSASWRVFNQLLGENVSAGAHLGGVNWSDGNIARTNEMNNVSPLVTYAYLKHIWGAGYQSTAYTNLLSFVSSQSLSISDHTMLKARAYMQLTSWLLILHNDVVSEDILPSVLSYAQMACNLVDSDDSNASIVSTAIASSYMNGYNGTFSSSNTNSTCTTGNSFVLPSYDRKKYSYKAWHAWAVLNYRVISLVPLSQRNHHIIHAIKGFFHSIVLAGDQSLQDILRVLTLWFTYAIDSEIETCMNEGFHSISIDTWLPVIPQILARIDSPHPNIRRMISALLCNVGTSHPQSLVYPLAVVLKQQNPASVKESSASTIMYSLVRHSALLVEEAMMCSKELIRVAILWHEMWHEALEEASRLWFGQHNVDSMITLLRPLHALINNGAHTLREVGFIQSYGRDLAEAEEWTNKYQRTQFESDLNAAWDLYCTVFRKINKQLSSMNDLDLQYISPLLLHARNLQLAMPGTYLADRDSTSTTSVTISSFVRQLKVIDSKQRPRKLSILGSDGYEYTFLLKGHEDLRQDKRVMQLFGLVNTFLLNDKETSKKDLKIRGYSVIPLSPESGLIQWLHSCDTLHALIKDYREHNNILLNIEHRLMLSMSPDYTSNTLIQKIESFEYALSKTSGQDLAKVIWLQSKTAEEWLERRTHYTYTLAVMSMVGYILGLGDRHPCNLLVDRHNSRLVHVDFGDCFEVAQTREKFPEKIPFRLTRMLISAMEVSGIEGSYRVVCQAVLRVLRQQKESVMAVLEAFVYDPLLAWRLLKHKTSVHTVGESDNAPGVNLGAVGGDNNDNNDIKDKLYQPGLHPISTLNVVDSEDDSGGSAEGLPSPPTPNETLNAKALSVIARVEAKLLGRDFEATSTATSTNTSGNGVNLGVSVTNGLKVNGVTSNNLGNTGSLNVNVNIGGGMDVSSQVERLIQEATSHVNLCQCYVGWCAFW